MADAWYEVLSVLHLMAMVCLLQANTLLLPRSYGDGYAPRVSEESRRATVDVFLKAAGYLACAIRHVIPQIPPELRRQLPVDLVEGNLKALSLQALGQVVSSQPSKLDYLSSRTAYQMLPQYKSIPSPFDLFNFF